MQSVIVFLRTFAHSLRRWAWQEFGPLEPGDGQCMDCGKDQTPDEEFHYIATCARCEAIASKEIR
jgi:hypothetical protein